MSQEVQPHNIPAPAPQQGFSLMQQGVEKLRQHAELKGMAMDYAQFITQTGACPDIYRGKPHDAAAAIIRGTALGFDPDGALEAFFVIKGKTGMYARAMIAVAEKSGCDVWEESATDTEVVWCGTRPGSDKVERVVWSIDRAKKAGYTSNKKYQENPAEMLRAKCQSELARIIAPGALMGIVSEVEKDEVQLTRARATRTDHGVSALKAKVQTQTEQPELEQPKPEVSEFVQQFITEISGFEDFDSLKIFMQSIPDNAMSDTEYDQVKAAANQKVAREGWSY